MESAWTRISLSYRSFITNCYIISIMRRVFYTFICLFYLCTNLYPNINIKLSFLVNNRKHRIAIRRIIDMFHEESKGIEVTLIEFSNEKYHEWFNSWQEEDVDILVWFAGYQLLELGENGEIYPITEYWNDNEMNKSFPAIKGSIFGDNGEVWALPISYYHWGFYYKRKLFEKHDLQKPKNWNEFLALCEELKNIGITPLGMGVKNNWPAASWFSYLNLRLNGIEFHKELLSGKASYRDDRVRIVFEEWKNCWMLDILIKIGMIKIGEEYFPIYIER